MVAARQGERIQLVRTSDEFTRLEPGDRGTVKFVDSLGTVHVSWDRGGFLGLVPGEDSWILITEEDDKER